MTNKTYCAKYAYASEAAANKRIEKLQKQKGYEIVLRPAKCKVCDKWHLE